MDTRKIFSLLTFSVGKVAENYFVEHAQDFLKPRSNAQPPDQYYLNNNVAINKVEEIYVQSGGRQLFAHKLKLKTVFDEPVTLPPIAMVYMPGNNEYIQDSLPNMEILVGQIYTQLKLTKIPLQIDCFHQHYRGRGANQQNDKENFNDYDQLQDAKDQAALIRKLVDDGYQPENIVLIGYSYGSAVLISALYELIKNVSPVYANIKALSDRGYGNPFDFRALKPIIYDADLAQKRLHQKGLLPEFPLSDIVRNFLPEVFVLSIENDWCIWDDYSLANSFSPNEMPGRVMQGRAENYKNSHYADRANIHLKTLPEITYVHLVTAVLTETPIELQSTNAFIEPFKGYVLASGARRGDKNFISFPSHDAVLPNEDAKAIFISTSTLVKLQEELHDYCEKKAKRAAVSGLGVDYNAAWLSSGGVGWTVKNQLDTALQLMTFLYYPNAATCQTILDLENASGPHQSGELNPIFIKVIHFAKEYQQLQKFNDWIKSMPNRREERLQKMLIMEQELPKSWEVIENDHASHTEDLSTSLQFR